MELLCWRELKSAEAGALSRVELTSLDLLHGHRVRARGFMWQWVAALLALATVQTMAMALLV